MREHAVRFSDSIPNNLKKRLNGFYKQQKEWKDTRDEEIEQYNKRQLEIQRHKNQESKEKQQHKKRISLQQELQLTDPPKPKRGSTKR